MKKFISVLALAAVSMSVLLPVNSAMAQYYERDYGPRWHRDYGPPPERRQRRDDGAIIAGGIAAGVLGGLIGGALANDSGPRYIDPPPPPPPQCWFEDRSVRNAYNPGWHVERVRVCD